MGLIKEFRCFGIVIVMFVLHVTANDTVKIGRYKELQNLFSLLDPYVLPLKRPPIDLEHIHDCYCPRVYWPACGKDNVTYVNGCIMNCLKKTTLKRFGPCINYRRGGIDYGVNFPAEWMHSNSSFIRLKKDEERNEDLVGYNISLPPDWGDTGNVVVLRNTKSNDTLM